MLYSRTPEDRKIRFFLSMLKHILNGDKSYAKLVDPVIMESRDLANGNKDFFTIDRDGYPIIVFLAEKGKSFLLDINVSSISMGDYKRISDLLEQQQELVVA